MAPTLTINSSLDKRLHLLQSYDVTLQCFTFWPGMTSQNMTQSFLLHMIQVHMWQLLWNHAVIQAVRLRTVGNHKEVLCVFCIMKNKELIA